MSRTAAPQSVIEVVAIADIEHRHRDRITADCSETERRWLATKPLQTIAGQLALKAALGRLIRDDLGESTVSLRCVDILRDENGAPYLKGAPELDADLRRRLEQDVMVSISHSRTSAVGMATLRRSDP